MYVFVGNGKNDFFYVDDAITPEDAVEQIDRNYSQVEALFP
jgi:hypothetical protein